MRVSPLIVSLAIVLIGVDTDLVAAPADQSPPKQPNVVLILADDLGWADTTLYGHTNLYETPHLKRLARRGMLFTRAYSASPLCSPTRASLLTGQSPARTGFTAPNGHLAKTVLKPVIRAKTSPANKALPVDSITRLDPRLPTLGQLFKQYGYATGHFGKWHLGPEPYSPLQHGFDVDIPHLNGPGPPGSFVAPWRTDRLRPAKPREHIEDRMAREAVEWMTSLPDDKPFFLNYWMFSVHAPFDAKAELIDKYRNRIDLDQPQRSPTYAAMVESMDDAVGTLINAVDRAGLADRTVFVFTSDNGGNMYNGIRETAANGRGFVATVTSNAPLRGGKANPWEGGTRVPQIIAWPGITSPGSTTDIVTNTTDLYPTLLDGIGIDRPTNHPIDGESLLPALKGKSQKRGPVFSYFPHNPPVPDWLPPSATVLVGDWKLIRLFHEGENGAHGYRLHNLAEDIGERVNLADTFPDRVKRLDRLIEQHLTETDAVVPLPNPDFDPARYNPERIGRQPGGLKIGRRPNTPVKPKPRPNN